MPGVIMQHDALYAAWNSMCEEQQASVCKLLAQHLYKLPRGIRTDRTDKMYSQVFADYVAAETRCSQECSHSAELWRRLCLEGTCKRSGTMEEFLAWTMMHVMKGFLEHMDVLAYHKVPRYELRPVADSTVPATAILRRELWRQAL